MMMIMTTLTMINDDADDNNDDNDDDNDDDDEDDAKSNSYILAQHSECI